MKISPILLLLAAEPVFAFQNGPWRDELDTGSPASDTGLANSRDTGGFTHERGFGRTPSELCSSQVLHNGVQLPRMDELYSYWAEDQVWGTPEMIEAIVSASEEMAWLMPDADPIIIGDISRRGGGYLEGHKSHRAGIDADIGLFTTDGVRGGIQVRSFGAVTPETIDYEANWLFFRSLLETGLVEWILLDQSLIDAMREHLIATGELTSKEAHEIFPPAGTPKLWSMSGIFRHAPSHRDHIHLRVKCGVEANAEEDASAPAEIEVPAFLPADFLP